MLYLFWPAFWIICVQTTSNPSVGFLVSKNLQNCLCTQAPCQPLEMSSTKPPFPVTREPYLLSERWLGWQVWLQTLCKCEYGILLDCQVLLVAANELMKNVASLHAPDDQVPCEMLGGERRHFSFLGFIFLPASHSNTSSLSLCLSFPPSLSLFSPSPSLSLSLPPFPTVLPSLHPSIPVLLFLFLRTLEAKNRKQNK